MPQLAQTPFLTNRKYSSSKIETVGSLKGGAGRCARLREGQAVVPTLQKGGPTLQTQQGGADRCARHSREGQAGVPTLQKGVPTQQT